MFDFFLLVMQPDDGLSRKKLVAWILIGFVLAIVIAVILAVALLKVKEPSIQVLSVAVDGVSPKIAYPFTDTKVNLTLNVQLLVQNQNKASFMNGKGMSLLLYNGEPVGKDIINPGLIPSKGSTTLATRMTLQADKMGTDIIDLAEEGLAGEVNLGHSYDHSRYGRDILEIYQEPYCCTVQMPVCRWISNLTDQVPDMRDQHMVLRELLDDV